MSTHAVLSLFTPRSRTRQRKHRDASVDDALASDSDDDQEMALEPVPAAAGADHKGPAMHEVKAAAVVREHNDDIEAKRSHALGQMARILAKQKTQKLRQKYKRNAQFPMYVSGADPFFGLAQPLSNYLCLLPEIEAGADGNADAADGKAAVAGEKAAVGDRKAVEVKAGALRKRSADSDDSGGSDCSGSEADSDNDSEPDVDNADLPEAADSGEAKAEPASNSRADGEDKKDEKGEKDEKDEKDEKYEKDEKSKSAAAAGVDISIAFFVETSYVDELRAAGVSKRGRVKRLTGASAAKLFSGA